MAAKAFTLYVVLQESPVGIVSVYVPVPGELGLLETIAEPVVIVPTSYLKPTQLVPLSQYPPLLVMLPVNVALFGPVATADDNETVGVQAIVVNVPSVPYPVPPAFEAYALT